LLLPRTGLPLVPALVLDPDGADERTAQRPGALSVISSDHLDSRGSKLVESNGLTIENGVAGVALGPEGPAPSDREKRMIRQQISATLQVIPSISSIELTIGGQAVSASLQPKTDTSVQVDGPPVVLADNHLSRVSGTTVAKVENSPDLKKA